MSNTRLLLAVTLGCVLSSAASTRSKTRWTLSFGTIWPPRSRPDGNRIEEV